MDEIDEQTMPPEPSDPALSPEQAAEMIRYYHAKDNKKERERGWKDKVPLGRSAIHTTIPSQSILPGNDPDPVLTWKEMEIGLDHIENPPKSDKYYARLDDLVDNKGFTYDDARRKLDADGMK